MRYGPIAKVCIEVGTFYKAIKWINKKMSASLTGPVNGPRQ